MVDADWPPHSVLVAAADLEQHLHGALVVGLYCIHLCLSATCQRCTVYATYADDVVQTPGIVEGLGGEEWDGDEGVDVLRKHAPPQFVRVKFVALGDGCPYLLIGNLQQILKPDTV